MPNNPKLNEPRLVILDPADPEQLWKASVLILGKAVTNPEKRAAMDAACNDPNVSRRELLSIGFSFGVSEISSMLCQGHVVSLDKSELR